MKKSTKFIVVVGIILLIFVIGLIFGSCEQCTNKVECDPVDTILVVDDTLNVDSVMTEEVAEFDSLFAE